ncbi:MAG: radical SAM protein [Deltaproteobacteria bacterium]|nr:radical SAM protein [Deltaproteobacteria bacterium]
MGDAALPYILPTIRDENLRFFKYMNFIAALRDRKRLAATVRACPIDATIDLFTACQLKCPYCAVGNQTIRRKVSHMKEDLFMWIANEILDATFITWFFSAGEPLLNKDVADLIGKVKEKEVFSVISTNLSLTLSDEKIDDLLSCGLGMISVSLDGASPETYVKYRRGGQFDLVLRNLRRLIQRKQQLGMTTPFIEWRYLLFEHNQHELHLAMQMAEDVQVDLFEVFPGYAPREPQGSDVRRATIPLPKAVRGPAYDKGRLRTQTTLQNHLYGRKEAVSPWNVSGSPTCDWLYYGTMIYPDGAMAPCCVATDEADDFTHISHHGSFCDAWNASVFTRTRKGMRDNLPTDTVCDHCLLPANKQYQFVQKVKGILRDAPDWALKILASKPDMFFLPEDYELMPLETGAITSGELTFDFDVERAIRHILEMKLPGRLDDGFVAEVVDMLRSNCIHGTDGEHLAHAWAS